MSAQVIERWHQALEARDASVLPSLLADDVVFQSPVVHTPQVGPQRVLAYLSAAFEALVNDSFRYVRQLHGERDAMLEFEVELEGIHVNGVDLIHWNDDNRIVNFKVMVRPLKAIEVVHRRMAAVLQARA